MTSGGMGWMLAAFGLALCLLPCGVAMTRGDMAERVVASQLAGSVAGCLALVLAVAAKEPSYADLAIAAVLLAFVETLVFMRFLERWL